jgi:hypothetical protein
LVGVVVILGAFEERNENVHDPVIIESVFLLEKFIHPDDAFRTKGSQPVFHQGQEFLFHFR